MNEALSTWNAADDETALQVILACCGSRRWAAAMLDARPLRDEDHLRRTADQLWNTMEQDDWMEAFACHPRIGQQASRHASAQSLEWSRGEQSSAATASDDTLAQLAAGNLAYEQRFGFTYIVCATGKTAGEMLSLLEKRLTNDRNAEMREAAEQQRQIMHIRLRKWLSA